jgi:hypothetical protein
MGFVFVIFFIAQVPRIKQRIANFGTNAEKREHHNPLRLPKSTAQFTLY